LPIIYDVRDQRTTSAERPMGSLVDRKPDGHHRESRLRVAVVSLVAFLAKAPAGSPIIDFRHAAVRSPFLHLGRRADDRIFSWFRARISTRIPRSRP